MKKIFIICLLGIASFACDNQPMSGIPYSQVYFDLDLYYQDQILQSISAYKTFTTRRNASDKTGFGGLLVYHGVLESGNKHNLWAFDLACPNEASPTVRIVPDGEKSAITATCPKCHAVYDLSAGGSPHSGSEFYLTRYKVISVDNKYEYRVVN